MADHRATRFGIEVTHPNGTKTFNSKAHIAKFVTEIDTIIANLQEKRAKHKKYIDDIEALEQVSR